MHCETAWQLDPVVNHAMRYLTDQTPAPHPQPCCQMQMIGQLQWMTIWGADTIMDLLTGANTLTGCLIFLVTPFFSFSSCFVAL